MTEKELSSESIMAKDLVCGMQVDKEKATARRWRELKYIYNKLIYIKK